MKSFDSRMIGVRWLDLAVIAAYMAALVFIGVRLRRRQTSTESYFVARRSVPSWAVGVSLFATIISAITFTAYPGSAYAENWSLLVPGGMIVLVLVLVGFVLIPFYRQAVGMSAYEYFGRRFGTGARIYGSFAFALGAFTKMAFVIYLVALTVNSMTGWSLDLVIAVAGVITIFYTLIGGIEAVIWTDVLQGFVLWIGIFVSLGFLLLLAPGGPSAALKLAWTSHKFSLGVLNPDFTKPTVIVLALYGLSWYLQKYTADQTVVQRYLVAKSDREALKGVALGALLCLPIWSLFMLIGTSLWSFYKLTGEPLPSHIAKADQVFPHFLATHVSHGLAGLIMAPLFGAGMATLSSDLNCLSVVAVEDYYRLLRPKSTDRERLWIAKLVVGVCGLLAISLAVLLGRTKGAALSMWYSASAIVAGGLAGLFLLAFLSPRANKQGAYIGIFAAFVFTAWATLTLGEKRALDLGRFNFRLHDYMIGVIGHIVVLVVGYLTSFLFPDRPGAKSELTLWGWLARKRALDSIR